MGVEEGVRFHIKDYLYDNIVWDDVDDEERSEVVKCTQELWQNYLRQAEASQLAHSINVISALFYHYAELICDRNVRNDSNKKKVYLNDVAGSFAYVWWVKSRVNFYNTSLDEEIYFDSYDLDVTLDSISHLVKTVLNDTTLPGMYKKFNETLYSFSTSQKYESELMESLTKVKRV